MLSEYKTRKKYIDKQLQNAGWNQKYIKEEVNPIKSDFVNKKIVLRGDKIEKNVDLFIDYLLIDENQNPLAIIEAKRYSKDPENGRIQARTYVNEIKSQTNNQIPIFLTNGEIWKIIDEYGVERKISTIFSQKDLKRRNYLYNNHKNPSREKINPNIVDRTRSIQIVRKLSEHFSKCFRSALIQMATGTGKTRVAMAIIDILINSNIARNVLFIADRSSLVRQAKEEGFKKYFNEPVTDLRDGFNTDSRLYVSTIQTLMKGKENEEKFFEKFSSGFFDLIIFDEAHRSIYDKNNLVYDYFDAIKIGLTATPKQTESKSTYDLFGNSTAEYSYDEAINDGILVPYKAHSISTQVLNEGIKSSDLDEFLKMQIIKQGIDPDKIELTGGQFDKIFMDEKTNDLVIITFMEQCYKSDDGKPAKSIFFCSSQKHAKSMKEEFDKFYPSLSSEVQVITSDMYRADDEVSRFKLESNPRIALSVGMLDTGVDIPEVCNLVFIKPIFSSIQFWQMLGRGTRNQQACKHKEWLPNQMKNDFLIMDFIIGGHSNIDYHELQSGHNQEPTTSTVESIFENRITLLERELTPDQLEIINKKIQGTLKEFRDELYVISQRKKDLDFLKNQEDLSGQIELLRTITPLTNYIEGNNAKVSSFIKESELLFGYVLDNDKEKIENTKKKIQFKIENVLEKDNLQEVQENSDNLKKVLQEKFWEDLTFDKIDYLVNTIAPTMKYFTYEKHEIIHISKEDKIIDWKEKDKEIQEDLKLKQLLEHSEEVKKLKEGQGITSHELLNLEKELSSLYPELNITTIQRTRHIDFIEFLREMIGLTRKENPKTIIEKRFDEVIINNVTLNGGEPFNSKQLEFLLLLKKVFSERKHIELKDFAEEPLNEGANLFGIDNLTSIVNQCNLIKMC